MNEYEAKQEARRARLQQAAEREHQRGEALLNESREMMDAIPFGQPILVGHYSEGRDRRYRDRAWNKMGKGVETLEHARELAGRAAAVGTAGISQDDPDALDKLRAQLAEAEAELEADKAVNKAIRKSRVTDAEAAIAVVPMTDKQAERLRMWWHAFRTLGLRPDSTRVRRIRERIAQLEKLRATDAREPITGPGWRIEDDPLVNRVVLSFDQRLDRETFRWVKSQGWRWSPAAEAFLAFRTQWPMLITWFVPRLRGRFGQNYWYAPTVIGNEIGGNKSIRPVE